MSRYYRNDHTPQPGYGTNFERLHDTRRGTIPQIESPKEKIARLRAQGYDISPAQKSAHSVETEFSRYDLGNKELPAYRHKQEIIDAIDESRITLLCGPTGSGKTTQLGQFALEAGYDRVVYLLPRRINVDNNTDRITEELTEPLGEERAKTVVGMAHSEQSTIDDQSMIQIMTSGTFTKKIPELSKRWADERVMIVADEMHENNLETEFASALAVRQVEQHETWRMVFASATPDKDAMQSYEVMNGGPIPVVEIEGRPHDLTFLEAEDKDIVEAYHEHSAGVQKAMIFVQGKAAIDEAIQALRKSMTPLESQQTKFFKLHAKISERAKDAIFSMELEPSERAIIVSTSAGQSGITVPGLGLVVTSGLTKSPELDSENAPGLPTRLCTQAEITQQGGRAGRDIDGGTCVLARPLHYSRHRNLDNQLYQFVPLSERAPDMPPEIYHSNISRNILAATNLGENFLEFNNYLKHSVTQRTIHDSYEVLYNLGAVDEDNRITDRGQVMDLFPLRPELSRAAAEILHSHKIQMQAYVLATAAAVETGGLADFDNGGGRWRDNLRSGTDDDFIAQLDMMLASREFFRGRSVDEDKLMEMGLDCKNVYRAHRQFDKMCQLIGLSARDIDLADPTADEENEIRTIFLKGMPDLIYEKKATVRRKGIYKNIWEQDEAIERTISSRSLLGAMGQSAVGLVAGYPRWYIDDYNERHDIVDFGFATSREQIRDALGDLATKHLAPEMKGGRLVRSGDLRLGSISIGKVNTFEARVASERERTMLVDTMMLADTPALGMLRDLGVDDATIRRICDQHAPNIGSVNELDALLWDEVARHQ